MSLFFGLCDWNKNGKLTDSFLILTLMASEIKVSLWTMAQPQCTSATDQVFKESWPKSQLNEKNLISPALKPGTWPSPPCRAWKTGWILVTYMINGVRVIFTYFQHSLWSMGSLCPPPYSWVSERARLEHNMALDFMSLEWLWHK